VTPQVYAKARAEIVALFGWGAAPAPPEEKREDPREAFLRMYFQVRARSAEAEEGYDGLVRKVERLQAELEQLRGGPAPAEPRPPMPLPPNVAVLPPEVGDPIAAARGPLIEVARGAVATGRAGRSAGCQSRAHGARLGAPERAAGPHPKRLRQRSCSLNIARSGSCLRRLTGTNR
jgi:hypothetical protein